MSMILHAALAAGLVLGAAPVAAQRPDAPAPKTEIGTIALDQDITLRHMIVRAMPGSSSAASSAGSAPMSVA